ncbi:hypothetical protein CANCADRAFT_111500 [Tortispora caseinolytica NRRL Y-17796]|uniref:Autophagy-related protein 27 n=1 Tax=Tortispora caseinolytica NRRL Y-17796 TaxID=767744 RepID=A0A1E4TGE7_9ASCO|nr:hypothetical protein CANCADRAFT_111500 [Tortispora caseinolytica NRRL Y-17796]
MKSHLYLATLTTASFHCDVVVDGIKFDLTPLKGPHSISVSEVLPPSVRNLTWTIDPCGPLQKSSDVPASDQCPSGTQVCGIETITIGDSKFVSQIIPVAGDIGGSTVDAGLSVLEGDPGGLRVVLHGGRWGEKRDLQAEIDFICSEEKDSPITLKGWDSTTLSLSWKTPYACASKDRPSKGGDDKSGDKPPQHSRPDKSGDSWGWFTWLFIILVLAFAAYIIVGSWVNYSRYGSTGVDMIPHSDTFRDIPYLVKDFASKISSTLSSSGSRGGYSAV